MTPVLRHLAVLVASTASLVAQEPDRGLGVVGLADSVWGARADTFAIVARPGGAEVVARWVRSSDRVGGEMHALVHGAATVPAPVLEYGYEISGLVVDSVDVSGRWARVQVGDTTAPAARRGWIDLRDPRLTLLRWAAYLPELDGVYALDPTRLVLHRAPNGARLPAPLVPRFDADDHWLEILERRGDWLRVRLTQPAMTCGAEPVTNGVTVEGWVRFLDGRGRPLVWYYTRGC